MGTARVAIVTSDMGLIHDIDLPLVLAGLRARGLEAEAVAWDADSVVWGDYHLAVIRSTWDYADRLDEFLTWADTTARVTHLANPASLVRWNSDKRYLLELAGRGVPVVPTRVFEPGDSCDEGDFAHPHGVVVKPAVSVAARDTARYEPGRATDAVAHARALLAQGRAVMVQPYLRRIAEGERALVFVGGSLSHALRKGEVLTEPGVIDNSREPHPDLVQHRPTEAELVTATAALEALPAAPAPLYARVDLALDDTGAPVLMELELIEPYLFLHTTASGLERLVEAVAVAAQARLTAR